MTQQTEQDNPFRTEEDATAFLTAHGFTAEQAKEALDTAERDPGRTFTRNGYMVALELEPPQDGFWIVKDDTATTTKAQPNEHGVTWATSRSGKLSIAVGPDKGSTGGWDVWALYTGTHDLAPVSKQFNGANAEQNARDYANQLWRTR